MSASSGDDPIVERNPAGKSDDLTGRALRLRIRQQELLAELGVLALQGTSFVELLNHTARITAEGLRAEYCKVMEFLPAENRLVVRAGVGWEEGVVGHATVGADLASPARAYAVDQGNAESESERQAKTTEDRQGGERTRPPTHHSDGRSFGACGYKSEGTLRTSPSSGQQSPGSPTLARPRAGRVHPSSPPIC